ncbi:MAG: aspartate--tRNA(Asn) ligase [Thermoplasmataceae archaeon]|jgi:aspartyl-tRNA synthetase
MQSQIVAATVSDLRNIKEGEEVVLNGWLQEIRLLKNISFLVLRDHTGTIQITSKPDITSGYDKLAQMTRETVITVTGTLTRKTQSKSGIEVLGKSIKVLNASKSPLPLGIIDPVGADIETRLTNRFLDLRKPEVALIFRTESELLWGMREFFHGSGFVEVHTPKIVAAATEGGADLFPVQYFEKQAYLNQSPQLYKEILISAGMNRVFEVGPAFRAEKHNTPRHLNEFTSIDIEMAFADHHDAMHMLQEGIKSGLKHLVSHRPDLFASLSQQVEVPEGDFPKITYRECIRKLDSHGETVKFGDDFTPEQLKLIGAEFTGFYFITEWPSSLRAFYTHPKPGDETVSNSFDLQYREFEITSGAQRVHDPGMLEERLKSKNLNPDDFSFYLNAFRYGMPPHAGWGLGLERLSLIILNLQNIREAILFPRDRTRITP